MHPVPAVKRKPTPRKAVGALLAGVAILVAGRYIAPASIQAVVTGLVGVFGIFATGHVLKDLQTGKTKPAEEEGS